MSAFDPFLMGLFREEMAEHSALLTDGLLSLERSGGSPEAIAPLMRAAHSIKGAARVVELMPVVQVAHVMEDLLVAAGEGKMALQGDSVDRLLGALDWITELAAVEEESLSGWLEARGSEAEQWVARLQECLRGGGAPSTGGEGEGASVATAPESAAEEARDPAPPLAVERETEPEPELCPEPVMAPPAGTPQAGVRGSVQQDASVRVNADMLSQILAQTADLLLEARRIGRLSSDLQAIKTLQRRAVAAARENRPGPGASACDALLLELGEHLDHYDQQMADLATRTHFLSERLHKLALQGRMRPFADGVQGFPRLVRDLARQLGKQVELTLSGQSTRVDRDILSQLEAPLNHLVRNALDHGLEEPAARRAVGKSAEGHLHLQAHHQSGRLQIKVSDDGRGIDPEGLRRRVVERGLVSPDMAGELTDAELFDFLFLPGFTTRDATSELSGRGVGLDVVQSMVQACGGQLQVRSEPGQGTRFELHLPVTRSVIRALRIEVGGQSFALPLARIERTMRVEASRLESLNGHSYWSQPPFGHVALVSLRRILGFDESADPATQLALVVIGLEGRYYALEVDALSGECDLVVRPLDPRLGKAPNLAAVSLDEQGLPVLILDVDDLVRSADRLSGQVQPPRRRVADQAPTSIKRILVVDDSLTVREVERKLLENSGYEVDVAVDGVDGWNQLTTQAYDLLVSDIDMPRMNGIELVTRIKADSRLGQLPVIIVSYKDREEDRVRGMQAGADYYLTKSSFHDARLIQAVQDLIGSPDGTF